MYSSYRKWHPPTCSPILSNEACQWSGWFMRRLGKEKADELDVFFCNKSFLKWWYGRMEEIRAIAANQFIRSLSHYLRRVFVNPRGFGLGISEPSTVFLDSFFQMLEPIQNCYNLKLHIMYTLKTNMTLETPIFNRKYIFKWWIMLVFRVCVCVCIFDPFIFGHHWYQAKIKRQETWGDWRLVDGDHLIQYQV